MYHHPYFRSCILPPPLTSVRLQDTLIGLNDKLVDEKRAKNVLLAHSVVDNDWRIAIGERLDCCVCVYVVYLSFLLIIHRMFAIGDLSLQCKRELSDKANRNRHELHSTIGHELDVVNKKFSVKNILVNIVYLVYMLISFIRKFRVKFL